MLRSMKALYATSMILSACAAAETEKGYQQQMETLLGASEEELVLRLGQPDKVRHGPNGKAFRYENIRYYLDHGAVRFRNETTNYTGSVGGTNFTATGTQRVMEREPDELRMSFCLTSFIIANDGRVANFKFDGPDCVAPEANRE